MRTLQQVTEATLKLYNERRKKAGEPETQTLSRQVESLGDIIMSELHDLRRYAEGIHNTTIELRRSARLEDINAILDEQKPEGYSLEFHIATAKKIENFLMNRKGFEEGWWGQLNYEVKTRILFDLANLLKEIYI